MSSSLQQSVRPTGQPQYTTCLRHMSAILITLSCVLGPSLSYASNLQTTPPLNYFGEVGLLQLPNARFAETGRISLGTSQSKPYNHYFVTIQSLPWLETTLGYTDIKDHDIRDKRLDTKIRLRKESNYWPQIALGIRNLTGTDTFSAEYLVASKRYHEWDFTLGFGWGYLATSQLLNNPLRLFGSHLVQRDKTRSSRWFRGEHASLFGGASYQMPIPGLVFKIELNPNNHLGEPNTTYFPSDGPVNIGLAYRPAPNLDFSLGLEGGDTLVAQAVVHSNLQIDKTPPPATYPSDKQVTHHAVDDPAQAMQSMVFDLEQQGYQVDAAQLQKNALTLRGSHQTITQIPQTLGRIARVASQYFSEQDIPQLTFIHQPQGFPTTAVVLPRWDFAKALTHQSSPEEIWQHTQLESAPTTTSTLLHPDTTYPLCDSSVIPQLGQHIPDDQNARYAYQLSANLAGRCTLNHHWSISGALNFNIANNIANLNPTNSQLPAVRRDIRNYIQKGKQGIEHLALHYQWKPSSSWYARVNAGLLEAMYAGVGTEWLYHPYNQPWAIGIDLNYVRQRGFNKLLSLRDYQTTTGHLNGYYHIAQHNIDAKFSVGRYLAKDIGATLDLSHRFDNGAKIGAYTTLTEKSATRYRDKGIYISVPLDLFLQGTYEPNINMKWHTLNQDHGQRLNHINPLYHITQDTHSSAIARDWHKLLD